MFIDNKFQVSTSCSKEILKEMEYIILYYMFSKKKSIKCNMKILTTNGKSFILSGCRLILTTVTSTALHYTVFSHADHHCLDMTVSLLRNIPKPETPWAE